MDAAQPEQQQTALVGCSLCHGQFESPKVLACWHSFCLRCLEGIVPENSITLVCPSCLMPSVLPKLGVGDLPDNWLVTQSGTDKLPGPEANTLDSCSFLSGSTSAPAFQTKSREPDDDVSRSSGHGERSKMADSGYYEWQGKNSTNEFGSQCDEKERPAQSLLQSPVCSSDFDRTSHQETASSSAAAAAVAFDDAGASRGHAFSPRSFRSSPDFLNQTPCRIHPNRPISSYCCQWELPLCRTCSLNDGHAKHRHLSLDLAVLRQRKELDAFVQTTERLLETLELNRSFLQRTMAELDRNRSAARRDAEHSFECLRKFLQERLRTCLGEIDVVYEHKSGVLEAQLRDVELASLDARRWHDIVERVLDSDGNEAVLLASKVLRDSKRNNRDPSAASPAGETSRPAETSFLEFDKRSAAAVIDACADVSFLSSERLARSQRVTLAREDLARLHVEGRQIKLGVQLEGECSSGERLACSLYAEVSLPNGNRIVPTVVRGQAGPRLAELQFQVREAGTCRVEVFSYGCPVFGSPFEITVHKSTAAAPPTRGRPPLERRRTMPAATKTSIPVSTGGAESRLRLHNSNNGSSNSNSNKIAADSGRNRPPWNSSFHLAPRLRRSSSSLTSRPTTTTETVTAATAATAAAAAAATAKTKKASSSRHQSLTDLTRVATHRDQGPSRFLGSMMAVKKKIELEAKIDEEPESPLNFDERKEDPDSRANPKLVRTSTNPSLHRTRLPVSTAHSLRPLAKLGMPIVVVGQKGQPKVDRDQSPTLHRPVCRSTALKFPAGGAPETPGGCRVIGRKGTKPGEFLHVQGVSFRNGLVFVADSKTRFVHVISYETGQVVTRFDNHDSSLKASSFGNAGAINSSSSISNSNSNSSPVCAVQDSQGFIYVSDFGRGWVFVFDVSGKQVRKIGNEVLGPKGILLDDQGKLTVIDTKSCSVQVYCSQTGRLSRRFGSRGYGESEMCGPHFCTLTADGRRLAVSDFGNGKVKVFTLDGCLVHSFGCPGTREGHVKKPTGLATDPETGHLIVADFELSRVQVFEEGGRYVRTVDTSSAPLSGPLGLCMADDGRIVVADSGNHCLKVFDYRVRPEVQ